MGPCSFLSSPSAAWSRAKRRRAPAFLSSMTAPMQISPWPGIWSEKQAYALYRSRRRRRCTTWLWRLAVALTTVITGNEGTAAYILGAVFSLVTILMCLRLSHLLFPFPSIHRVFGGSSHPCTVLLLTAVDQPSLAMSTTLFIAACLFHVEGLSERRTPLPMRSALLVGLLMWIHLEFFILWIVFFVHAIVMNVFNHERSTSTAFVVTRGLTGAFLLALCMFPLLAWNFSVIQVPWPQVVGAPFVMDTWLSAGPVEAIRSYLSLAGVPSRWRSRNSTPRHSCPARLSGSWSGSASCSSPASRSGGRRKDRTPWFYSFCF